MSSESLASNLFNNMNFNDHVSNLSCMKWGGGWGEGGCNDPVRVFLNKTLLRKKTPNIPIFCQAKFDKQETGRMFKKIQLFLKCGRRKVSKLINRSKKVA